MTFLIWAIVTLLVLGALVFVYVSASVNGRRGDTRVSILQSTPANASSAAQRSFAAIIAGATRSLYITNPYFVPTPPFVKALCDARSRGVEVKVVVPALITTNQRCGARVGTPGAIYWRATSRSTSIS